ncbi:MAG: DUF3267 domain-containing protein [Bacteroidales bacterium]
MEEHHHLEKEKLTINIVKANILAVVFTIPATLLFGLPYYIIWGSSSGRFRLNRGIASESDIFEILPFIVFFILGIILHELIHGITWAVYARSGFKSIRFGVLWKSLTPYCHCKESLSVKHYITGAIMPAIILGLIPGIISIIIGSSDLLILSIVFMVAGSGDFLIIYALRKEKSSDYVQDHPSEAGCYVYRHTK